MTSELRIEEGAEVNSGDVQRVCDRRNAAHKCDSNEQQSAGRPRGHLGNGAFTLDKRLVRPLVLLTVEVAWRAGGRRREGRTKPPTAHRPCDPARVMKLVLLRYKVFVISE